MSYRCAAGIHFFNSEEKADNCQTCRRKTDLAVKRHFKRLSNQMLADADVETRGGDNAETHDPERMEPIWKRRLK